MASINDDLRLSSQGINDLRRREGVVMRYYNDNHKPTDGNCTYGAGTLARLGPCTPEELKRMVDKQSVMASLLQHIAFAEREVKLFVPHHRLTQAQFDAAVSFAYNARRQDVRVVFMLADRGDLNAAANAMMRVVYVHAHDSHGRPVGSARFSPGLRNRRMEESAPFRQTP